MSVTLVSTPSTSVDESTWFGKNSDREPGEAQVVEHHGGAEHRATAEAQLTHVKIPQVWRTHAVVISRPSWMWGAEMGANEHGVCVANTRVHTRVKVARGGVLGQDLVRLTLERCVSADDAVTVLTSLLQAHGQGGRDGHRKKTRCHSAFLIADAACAWVVDTADVHWAAKRVDGLRTLSDALSIGQDFDRISDGAVSFARQQGWCARQQDFDFAAAFGDPRPTAMTGGERRRETTRLQMLRHTDEMSERVRATLRFHLGSPFDGLTSISPCAHASWLPTRHRQTTSSMIANLGSTGPRFWFTGTSSPCLSVFKPFGFGALAHRIETGPAPGATYDPDSLWWRHEHLHREVLRGWPDRSHIIPRPRAELEQRAFARTVTADQAARIWAQHREWLVDWTATVRDAPKVFNGPVHAYWALQNAADGMPGS